MNADYKKQLEEDRKKVIGKIIDGKKIVSIGLPISNKFSGPPPLLPVKLSDKTYRVLISADNLRCIKLNDSRLDNYLINSRRMPRVGLGSNSLKYVIYPRSKSILRIFVSEGANHREGDDRVRVIRRKIKQKKKGK